MKAVEAYQIAEQIHAQVTLEQYLETIYEKIKEYAEAGEKCILFLHAVDALPYPQPAMQEKIKNSLNNEGYSTTIQSRGLQISWEITEAKEEIPAPNNESSALPEVPTLELSPSEEKTVLIQIGIPHEKDLDYQEPYFFQYPKPKESKPYTDRNDRTSWVEELNEYQIQKKIDELKNDYDEPTFSLHGEEYQQYIEWRRKTETKINEEELKTGKRFVDGKSLSQSELQSIKEALKLNEPKVFYGCCGFILLYGHQFRFHCDGLTYSISIYNEMTKDEMFFEKKHFLFFPNYYSHYTRLSQSQENSKPDYIAQLAESVSRLILGPSKDLFCCDREIYENWMKAVRYSDYSNEVDKTRFNIAPEYYKQFLDWKAEKNVTQWYFCFEENSIAYTQFAVNKLTGEDINLTDYDSW